MFKHFLLILAETETEVDSTQSGTEQLMKIFKSPKLYIGLGVFIGLIIIIYLIRRFVKGRNDSVLVITRKGKFYKLLEGDNSRYFLVPFMDSASSRISKSEMTFATDKLFINDGPDHLYKIKFSFQYKVTDFEMYFNNQNDFQSLLEVKINDTLREFSDEGNANILIKDYKTNNDKIISLLNKASENMGIEVLSFKVNYIQPMNGNN